jgi:hypothetical protein
VSVDPFENTCTFGVEGKPTAGRLLGTYVGGNNVLTAGIKTRASGIQVVEFDLSKSELRSFNNIPGLSGASKVEFFGGARGIQGFAVVSSETSCQVSRIGARAPFGTFEGSLGVINQGSSAVVYDGRAVSVITRENSVNHFKLDGEGTPRVAVSEAVFGEIDRGETSDKNAVVAWEFSELGRGGRMREQKLIVPQGVDPASILQAIEAEGGSAIALQASLTSASSTPYFVGRVNLAGPHHEIVEVLRLNTAPMLASAHDRLVVVAAHSTRRNEKVFDVWVQDALGAPRQVGTIEGNLGAIDKIALSQDGRTLFFADPDSVYKVTLERD